MWTAASCHVVGLRDCTLVCLVAGMQRLLGLCSAVHVKPEEHLLFTQTHSRLAAETRRPWLRYGDLQTEQNSRLSCQTPLQSVLFIKPCNNTSFEAWFWWIYLTLYMTGIAQSSGTTLSWPSSWRVRKELSLSVHRAGWSSGSNRAGKSQEKGVLYALPVSFLPLEILPELTCWRWSKY